MNKTPIEWTDYSSNPIYAYDTLANKRGWACVKVSPGCARCYAETINKRFGTKRDYSVKGTAGVEMRISEKELAQYKRLKPGEKVFVGDMTDVFQDAVSDDMLHKLFHAMEQYSVGTFQILTKRAERMSKYLQWRWGDGRIPCRRIWVGCSVEDQARADERIPHLLKCPAAVRFLSAEPLLGAVDLTRIQISGSAATMSALRRSSVFAPHVDWVIVGGESGPGARPCNVEWVRSIVGQCKAAGTACFVKQLGARPTIESFDKSDGWPQHVTAVDDPLILNATRVHQDDGKGSDPTEWPEALRVREFPSVTRPPVAAAKGD